MRSWTLILTTTWAGHGPAVVEGFISAEEAETVGLEIIANRSMETSYRYWLKEGRGQIVGQNLFDGFLVVPGP